MGLSYKLRWLAGKKWTGFQHLQKQNDENHLIQERKINQSGYSFWGQS